jgi:hypothetical protein
MPELLDRGDKITITNEFDQGQTVRIDPLHGATDRTGKEKATAGARRLGSTRQATPELSFAGVPLQQKGFNLAAALFMAKEAGRTNAGIIDHQQITTTEI